DGGLRVRGLLPVTGLFLVVARVRALVAGLFLVTGFFLLAGFFLVTRLFLVTGFFRSEQRFALLRRERDAFGEQQRVAGDVSVRDPHEHFEVHVGIEVGGGEIGRAHV